MKKEVRRVVLDQAKIYGPQHDVSVEFDVTFADDKSAILCLYYPSIEQAMEVCEAEIKTVRKAVQSYNLVDYKDLVITNCLYFTRMFPEPLEHFSHIHKWERELWGLNNKD